MPQVNSRCVRNVLDENCGLADMWAMLLSNLSRPENLVDGVYGDIKSHMSQLFDAFTRLNYNKANCNLNHLGMHFHPSHTAKHIELIFHLICFTCSVSFQ